jgi:hypothetical protein
MKTLPLYVDFAQIFWGFTNLTMQGFKDTQFFFPETKDSITRGLAVYQFLASSPETPISESGISGTL